MRPQAVAVHREATLRPLLPALAGMPETAQAKWANWRRRQSHAHNLPERFADALSIVVAFTNLVLMEIPPENARWDPNSQQWKQHNP